MCLGLLEGYDLLIVLGIITLLFGASRLPQIGPGPWICLSRVQGGAENGTSAEAENQDLLAEASSK